MAYSFSEPLSAVDAAFLARENAKAHMHIGAVTIFDARPLLRPQGGLDIDRIRRFIATQLHKVPRFRQKVAFVPLSGQPMWVDDPTFNLTYHVRHTALPFPGDPQKLKDLTGRIMSQQLERAKPLWELWFAEGLDGNRFALISKIHHALADGISGLDLIAAIVGPNRDYREKPAPAWVPRRAPSPWELLSGQVGRWLSTPAQLLTRRQPAPPPAPPPTSGPSDIVTTLRRAIDAATAAIEAPDPTPLNVDVGPYRRFDWTRFDIETIKAVRSRLGGKMNDVVLSVVSGAVRKFLTRRGVAVRGLDFRALVPVSVRTADQRGQLGNRITQMLTRLPIDEADPVVRLRRVIEITSELKNSAQAQGVEAVPALTGLLGAPIAALARLAVRHSSGNMIITNLPGPAVPTYLLGAQTLEAYPLVPLASRQALNVAVLSYNGVLHWGFTADWDAVPDLADFVALVNEEIDGLRAAAHGAPVRLSKTAHARTGR